MSEMEKHFFVGWHDLDFNGHLNNSSFKKWMIETLPFQTLKNKSIKAIHIIYKAEAVYGHRLRSEVQQLEENSFLHRLVREEDEKELCIAWTILGDNV